MLMYNLIEYSDNYLKKIGIYGNITKMSQMITQQILSHLNLKKTTGHTTADGNTKDVERIVPLKYLINFWRTYVIANSTGAGRFAITDTNFMFHL